MSSPVAVSDDPNIQITIPPDDIPGQSHEQTPVAISAAASTQYENTLLNEMTPEFLSTLKRELFEFALTGDWLPARRIVYNFPTMACIPLTDRGDTAFHVAVVEGKMEFVDGLLIYNKHAMLIPNSDGMLPVHLALLTGQRYIFGRLSSQKVLDEMTSKDIERMFFIYISRDMFYEAINILAKHPTTLAIARNEEHLTALHMLARKPPEILDMKEYEHSNKSEAGRLFHNLWTQVNQLEHNRIMDLINHPSSVLFDAIKSGNVEAANLLLLKKRELVTIKDPNNGRNLLHFATLYRRGKIFFGLYPGIELLKGTVDNEGNNVLHLAAHLPVKFEALSSFGASIQMQNAVVWFKLIERNVALELKTMRNNMGKTPIDVFYDQHKELSEEIKVAAKGIAESGMLVATLVATVAFAAALTVPGDKTNRWFIVFILTCAVALFASSTSIFSFLSIFTSPRFRQGNVILSLHPGLVWGLMSLLFSVVAMVVAFTAASFLIFDHTSKWAAYVVASMGVLPILLFFWSQFSFWEDFSSSRHFRRSKLL